MYHFDPVAALARRHWWGTLVGHAEIRVGAQAPPEFDHPPAAPALIHFIHSSIILLISVYITSICGILHELVCESIVHPLQVELIALFESFLI